MAVSEELYNKIKENVQEYVEQNSNKTPRERVVKIITNDICDETKSSIRYCTPKQTEAYRKLMGLNKNGERQSYAEVSKELRKKNIRDLTRLATLNVIRGVGFDEEYEIHAMCIRKDIGYDKNKYIILPEEIPLEKLIFYNKRINTNKTLKDLLELTEEDALRVIYLSIKASTTDWNENFESRMRNIKKTITLVHMLGYVFKGEKGYIEQQMGLQEIRRRIKDTNIKNEDINNNINQRNELIDCHESLGKEYMKLKQEGAMLLDKKQELEEQIKINSLKLRATVEELLETERNLIDEEIKIRKRF